MSDNNKRLYILSGVFALALLLGCFVLKNNYTNLLISLAVFLFSTAFHFVLKKRSILKIQYRQVTALMLAAAVIAISVYYFTGLGFGFYKTPFGTVYIYKYILPYTLSIVCVEYLRRVILSQENKVINVLSYFMFVLFDVLLFMDTNAFRTFSKFTDFLGFSLFPAITGNLLYHYLCKRYGCLPNVAYRILISLYPYFFPVAPKMPSAMLAFLKLLLPLVLIVFVNSLYEPKKRTVSRQTILLKRITTVLSAVLMASFVMLISCQFRFGLLVIATDSMTGALNRGDAIIYEEYTDQIINEGQIIVFDRDNRKTVHRVIDVKKINGQLRFYTKGDANEAADTGYVTTDDIIGIQTLKIKYLGYPTVWMRELFK